MSLNLRNTTIAIIRAATSAHRCREAAQGADAETRVSLLRAADRYSGKIAELAGELVTTGGGR